MAKRRRRSSRRGAGDRFVKGSGGEARKSRRRRRRNPLGAALSAARLRLSVTRLRRVRAERAELGAAPKRRRKSRRKSSKTRVKARRLKRGLYRVNPRHRRRNPLVLKRVRRRGGKTHTVYLTKRKRRGRRSAFRRLNPGRNPVRGITRTIKDLLTIKTAYSGLQVGAGIVIDRAAPALLARYSGYDLESGWRGLATGLGSNVVVSALLAALGMPNAAAKVLLGGVGSTGARVLQQAIGYVGGGTMRPVRRTGPVSGLRGLGSVVSPETLVETQALLGDFVQLQGGIPTRDLRGLGDYVEFGSQAAGANALAAQLSPTAVFSPGADEKF